MQAADTAALLRETASYLELQGDRYRALAYDRAARSIEGVIASIHKRHKLDEDGMTRRLVAAMRLPLFKIWGHALGRILLHRDPGPCRFEEVLDAIAASPVAIEINGDPRRLDLDPVRARQGRERGARFVLSTDAPSVRQLEHVVAAVGIARRARIRRHEVLNALPAEDFVHAVRPLPGAWQGALRAAP